MPQLVSKQRTRWAMLTVTALFASLFAVGAAPAGAVPDMKQTLAMTVNPACVGAALADKQFTDVTYNQDEINCLAYYEVTTGTGDGTTFSPGDNVTRWQMALFMQRAVGASDLTLAAPVGQGLVDISGLKPAYQDAINQLVAADIMPATGTAFNPYGTVSRADMALIIARFLSKVSSQVVMDTTTAAKAIQLYKLTGGTLSTTALELDKPFTDALTQATAQQSNAISVLYELGVANGTSATMFTPMAMVTRAQMAAFITRALGFTSARPEGITVRPTSVSSNVYIVSVQSSSRVALANKWVDVFYVEGTDKALKADGTCDPLTVQAVNASGQACVIDALDGNTDADGEFTIEVSSDPDEARTLWVWTGDLSSEVNSKTSLVSYTIPAAPASANTAGAYQITSNLNPNAEYARLTDTLTATLQLLEKSGNTPVAKAGWEFNITVSSYSNVPGTPVSTQGGDKGNIDVTSAADLHKTRTVIVTTDADGRATFPFGGSHDNISSASKDIDPIAVLMKVESCYDPDEDVAAGGTASNECGVKYQSGDLTSENVDGNLDNQDFETTMNRGVVFYNVLTPSAKNIKVLRPSTFTKLGGQATHQMTLLVTDEYGRGLRNQKVTITRAAGKNDSLTGTRVPVKRHTTNNGSVSVRITQPSLAVAKNGAEESLVVTVTTPDKAPVVRSTVNIFWAGEETEAASDGGAYKVRGGDVDSNTIIVSKGGNLSYLTYDTSDQFNAHPLGEVGDTSAVLPAEFVKILTNDLKQLADDKMQASVANLTLEWTGRNAKPPPYNSATTVVTWTLKNKK